MRAFDIDKGVSFTVGQYVSRIVPSASALALSSGVAIDIISVSLPRGHWSLSGECWFAVTSGTPSIGQLGCWIGDTSSTFPGDPADHMAVNVMEINQSRSAGAAVGFVLPLGIAIVDVTTPLTIYLTAQASWTAAGTLTCYGKLAGTQTPI
jgi:hypothetical protein